MLLHTVQTVFTRKIVKILFSSKILSEGKQKLLKNDFVGVDFCGLHVGDISTLRLQPRLGIVGLVSDVKTIWYM